MPRTMLRLDPLIPLATPKGNALAHIAIDYGAEDDLLWVCIQTDGGTIWCWNNKDVRRQVNISMRRGEIKWAS
jgi:hypothetical protein